MISNKTTGTDENNKISEKFRQVKLEAENNLKKLYNETLPRIYIGMSTCCKAAGSDEVKTVFETSLNDNNIMATLLPVGCMGHCYAEPYAIVHNPGFPAIMYHSLTPGIARLIVTSYLMNGDPLFEYLLGATEQNEMIPALNDFSRFYTEERVIMNLCGRINPEDIDDYIVNDGYSGLVKALSASQKEIIDVIKASGLRGRGGAGFLTGIKWEMIYNEDRNEKYIVCNADEGDPGAYMDRSLLESNPHQLLEGLTICSYAAGAENAVIYIRSEYPQAVDILQKAIIQAEEKNLLGSNILGSNFNLNVRIFKGSGAFVCGEETALLRSIEGKRGMPDLRPPYPVEHGLFGKPTLINNVKTLSYIPYIIKNGSDQFLKTGAEKSPGTAIFSIVGDVIHPGLVEIPMGVSIRSLIFDTCGGIPKNKNFKAVQIGGPSGGCLGEALLDSPIDFDSLTEAGAMMGSGGMVVMDDDSCMVDVAKYFLEFTQNESCGKCTFCRIGTKHILNILDRLTKGMGVQGDLELLADLCNDVKDGSLCGLGKTAPNPVLTSLNYFRNEYKAHLDEKRCPALKCRSLTAYYIDLEKCARGCDACVGTCPVEAVFTAKNMKKAIDQTKCVKCGECMTACPPEYDAVKKVSPPDLAPVVERPEPEKETLDNNL